MVESLEQRQAAMRKVIQHIIDGKPYSNLTFEERRIAKECAEMGYIEGVELVEMITGNVKMEYQFPPRLTLEGVRFMNGTDKPESAKIEAEAQPLPNIGEKGPSDDCEKKDDTVKKIFNVIKLVANRLWGLFVALGVFVTVLGWPLIIQFFTWLLSPLFSLFK